jgi:hypothetical protein
LLFGIALSEVKNVDHRPGSVRMSNLSYTGSVATRTKVGQKISASYEFQRRSRERYRPLSIVESTWNDPSPHLLSVSHFWPSSGEHRWEAQQTRPAG